MLRAIVALTITTGGLAVSTAASTAPAAALTNYVVTTTDDVVATDGLLSLREAMIEADSDGDDSTITLGVGLTYELDLCVMKEPYDNGTGNFVAPADDDANLDGDLDHSEANDLTIYGNGSTIDQLCDYDRVIHSMHDQTHLVIDDTTVRGGDDAPDLGDNIRAVGSVTLQNGTVVTDGAPFNGGGAAVYVVDESSNTAPYATLSIVDSTITGNDQTGALIDYGTLVVDGSTVTNNDGSGVAASFSTIAVTGSTITGNLSTGIGGIDSSVDLSDSTVSNNGQGVSATGNTPFASPMVVTDSTIDGNEFGGLSCGFCQTVTVTDSAITNNGSLDGPLGTFGGISMFSYDVNDGVLVTRSTIAGNRTPSDGGAINARFVSDFGEEGVLPLVLLDDSDVYNNRSGILSDGGAVYVERANVAIVNGSSLNDNRAKPSDRLVGGDGGALWVEEALTVDIEDSYLTGNQAHSDGGTVYARDVGIMRIDGSLVADGRALGGGGGGLHLHGVADLRVTDSSIIDNESQQAGAGFHLGSIGEEIYVADFEGSTVARNEGGRRHQRRRRDLRRRRTVRAAHDQLDGGPQHSVRPWGRDRSAGLGCGEPDPHHDGVERVDVGRRRQPLSPERSAAGLGDGDRRRPRRWTRLRHLRRGGGVGRLQHLGRQLVRFRRPQRQDGRGGAGTRRTGRQRRADPHPAAGQDQPAGQRHPARFVPQADRSAWCGPTGRCPLRRRRGGGGRPRRRPRRLQESWRRRSRPPRLHHHQDAGRR